MLKLTHIQVLPNPEPRPRPGLRGGLLGYLRVHTGEREKTEETREGDMP